MMINSSLTYINLFAFVLLPQVPDLHHFLIIALLSSLCLGTSSPQLIRWEIANSDGISPIAPNMTNPHLHLCSLSSAFLTSSFYLSLFFIEYRIISYESIIELCFLVESGATKPGNSCDNINSWNSLLCSFQGLFRRPRSDNDDPPLFEQAQEVGKLCCIDKR